MLELFQVFDIPVSDIPVSDIPVTDIPDTDIPATEILVTDIPVPYFPAIAISVPTSRFQPLRLYYFVRVKEETNTRIDLPNENIDSDLIIITGKKADVDLARKKLLAIQAELEGMSK